jgi:ribosomal protein S21
VFVYHAKRGDLEDMARVEVDGDLERALKKFNKKVTDERILAEYKKREHFTAKKKRKRAKRVS